MADALPFFAAETGTYSTTGPAVSLSGTAASLGAYPTRTFAAADADATTTFASTNTCTVVIVKDANNYKRYTGAVWTSGSTCTIGLSTATLEGSAGTLSNNDAVVVFGSLPSAHASSHASGQADALAPSAIGAEPVLGNPASSGYVLSSTTGGARSWIAPPSGGGDSFNPFLLMGA